VKYNELVNEVELVGFNPGIFDAEVPTAKHVERVEDEDEQVRQLLAQKGAFCSSALWNVCGTRVGNAGVVLRAQKEQLALDAAKAAAVEKKRDDEKAVKLTKARAALRKYHDNTSSLTDKDWGDVIRWVLPAAGVSFLVKDYQKKDVIIAKLETLEQAWTSFIPPLDEPLQVPVN
jgi:hypothetical protein